MSEKNFTRALALALSNVLPLAKQAVADKDNTIEHTDAHASRVEHEHGDKQAADAIRIGQADDIVSHRAAVRRVNRAEKLITQFNETEQHVKDLAEDAFDNEFEIKFED